MTFDEISNIVSIVGPFAGTIIGVLVSNKSRDERIDKLEKKVDEIIDFNRKVDLLEEKLKVANHRIDNLEADHKEIEKEVKEITLRRRSTDH